jgi:hypothetical protein
MHSAFGADPIFWDRDIATSRSLREGPNALAARLEQKPGAPATPEMGVSTDSGGAVGVQAWWSKLKGVERWCAH